jgi:hypothetical protein
VRFLLLISAFVLFCSGGKKLLFPEPGKKIRGGEDTVKTKSCEGLCQNVVGLLNPFTNYNENYIFDSSLYQLKVNELPQIKFWRQIMNLEEDSALLCFAHNREVLRKVSIKDWESQKDSVRKFMRDSIRLARGLDSSYRILFTTGKKFFYDFEKTYRNFHNGINCFVENGVDPWYAQAILLIESPNKLQKSNAGAYGPFQLMKDVARLYGLKVNRQMDERANFERSAYAASSLIKNICIPRVHKMLDSLKISNQNESELWFKLLVMHTYHAGYYNVQSALFSFSPKEGNMDMIYNLWNARTARFKNASQNYSQLILAAMLEMNDKHKSWQKPPVVTQTKAAKSKKAG